jgi:hypothetical protein
MIIGIHNELNYTMIQMRYEPDCRYEVTCNPFMTGISVKEGSGDLK